MWTRQQEAVTLRAFRRWRESASRKRRLKESNIECPLTSETPPEELRFYIFPADGRGPPQMYNVKALYLYLRNEFKRQDPLTNRYLTPLELIRIEDAAAKYCSVHLKDSNILHMVYRRFMHLPLPVYANDVDTCYTGNALGSMNAYERGQYFLGQIDKMHRDYQCRLEHEDLFVDEVVRAFEQGSRDFLGLLNVMTTGAILLPIHKIKALVKACEQVIDRMCPDCDDRCEGKVLRATMISVIRTYLEMRKSWPREKRKHDDDEASGSKRPRPNDLSDLSNLATIIIQTL